METKIFTLVFLTMLLAMGLASAAALELDLVSAPTTMVAGNSVTITFNLSSPDATINYNALDWSASSSSIGTLTLPTLTSMVKNSTQELTVTLSVPSTTTGSTANVIIDLQSETAAGAQLTIPSITVTQPTMPKEVLSSMLLPNPNNDLQVDIDDIQVISGFGEDEEWLPMDEVEIEVTISNDNRDEKIKDIVVGWGLYNEATDEWYIDDEENDFNLKGKDDKTFTITFKLDEDIESLEDYDKFYVWVNAVDYNGDEIGAYTSEDISIQSETDFVILDDIRVVESIECDMDLQISADVWNIGIDDQEGVYVIISEPDLGISKRIEIGDINAFDNEKLDVLIQIPEDAKEGSYYLRLKVYDEDDDIYVNDYNEDSADFMVPIKVEGNCKIAPQVTITATIESGGQAGKELTIKSSIKNTYSKQVTYTLEAADYTTWASLSNINPQVIVLEAGESADVIYTLKVNKDISGTQTFNIVVKTGDTEKETIKQPVSVTIEESKGFSFPGFSGNAIQGDNLYLWGIGALNVILIIIIIVVAIRVARS